MRVLVTGGAGFIGSHVVDRLIAGGHEPLLFDRRTSPYHHPGEVETFIGDVLDFDAVQRALAGCEAAVHLAAAADVAEVVADPVRAEALNAGGTLNVLEAARLGGPARVIYASTIWVYGGDGAAQELDEDSPVGVPRHLYTATKLAGEMYCKSYSALYGVPYTILRFGIPYGPRAREAAVIPAFIGKALAGEPLTIAGDGRQSRRFVYVEDLADGVVRALGPVAVNRIYNLVSDEDVTIKQIAATVQALIGVGGVAISGERARRDLGWTASTPLLDGVRRYIEWRTEPTPAVDVASVRPNERERSSPLSLVERRARPRQRSTAQLAAFAAMVLGLAALVVAGLAALHVVPGPEYKDTFDTLALFSLAAYLAVAPDWSNGRGRALLVSCTLAAMFALLILPPWSREALDAARTHDGFALVTGAAVVLMALLGARASAGGRAERPRT